ncbi:hypothetical protein [Nocardia higoensis]|uniref:hypothetical protein n=1 Tax=Nocardia higoensis TaxID=228599 RepID=UPI0002DA2476|nr:hypothetical protein [Nocardia higoensis]
MIARLRATTVGAMVAATVAGCAADTVHMPAADRSVCRAAGLPAPFDQIDPCAGQQVLAVAVRAVFTYQPLHQRDLAEALRSARPLLDDRFAAQAMSTTQVWGPITPARWQQWRENRTEVHTHVRLTADDHPPDTPTRLARVLGVELDVPTDGVIGFPVYAIVIRAGDGQGWRLAGLRVPQ